MSVCGMKTLCVLLGLLVRKDARMLNRPASIEKAMETIFIQVFPEAFDKNLPLT